MYIENSGIYFTFRIVVLTINTLGMVCSTTDFKYSAKKVLHILSFYILYVLFSTSALVYFLGYLVFLRVSLLTISLPGILLVYILAKDQPTRAIFNYTTQILFSMYCCLSILLINICLFHP